MNISFNEKNRTFAIETENSGYYIAIVDKENFVGHVHYGKKISIEDNLPHLLRIDELPEVPTKNNRDRLSFYDAFHWEYPCAGIGDFRESALNISNSKGQNAVNLSYVSHKITNGKPALQGLPATWGNSADSMTLELLCEDKTLGLEVELFYSVFKGIDAIARSVKITNKGKENLEIEKAYSMNLDMDNKNFDFISLHGSWARERHIDRTPLFHGKMNVASLRGETSHQEHSFIALASKNTDYNAGEVYGISLIYSGNFISQAQLDQFDSVRVQTGIHSEGFRWHLEPGQSFQTPEAVAVYAAEGLNAMSRSFHDLWREHLIRGEYRDKMRPILINNWEATYFDFDTDKLLSIAKEAGKSGIEMLVMDDGWFGHRNNDESSLGDWFVNEEKLKGGLRHLVDEVNGLGMKFGIWFEPEMISPDSELYKQHPDWALKIENRTAGLARCQYVLDLSRKEVCDYTYGQIKKILESANIEYVKWDMNRPLADAGSALLKKENAGELLHRYVLAVYELQDRLTKDFPHLLLENCSGGGARFDAGMLYYSPQIWCSDDTDAIERLEIQEGTSLVYPLSALGAHVSVCPNHAVGRVTPFRTRGFVALSGTFGYELDITKLSAEDKALIPEQIAMYKKFNSLIRTGDYYRLESYSQNKEWDAWQVVAKDKSEALITVVNVLNHPNFHSRIIFPKSLCPERRYKIEIEDSTGKKSEAGTWTGSTLMNGGLLVNRQWGDFQSQLIHLAGI
ncbi:MAG TPA: alpha-galactosidase [Treponema sp.]|nr:alpha-galactosidase [Treponema sp.]